jgi:hypothetical protein
MAKPEQTIVEDMRPEPVEPEIIPPGAQPEHKGLTDDTLAVLASLLDDVFRIPGTPIRFGIDPLIGLIPGLGDLISSLASFLIIFAAWQRGLPRVTMGRMVANVAIDTLLGSVPVAGDMFDVAWKSNRKNLRLLQRASAPRSRSQNWRDWAFLVAVAAITVVLATVPLLVLWLIIRSLRQG